MPDHLNPEEKIPHLPEDDPVAPDADSKVDVSDDQFNTANKAWIDLRYSGVRGWLMFFIVTLVFISPLRMSASLEQYNSDWKPFYPTYPFLKISNFINIVAGLGLICFSVYAGYQLWKVRPKAVQIAKTYLLVSAIGWIILTCLPLVAGLPESANTAMLQVLPVEILKILVYPTVWYLYLSQSKRVTTTYGFAL